MNIWPIFSLGVAIANNYNIARQFWVVCVNSPGQMTKGKYIVVEGPIGVGKTSLAKILANEFQARTVFERVEDNPFLPKFYKARETYAFQNQTFFLINRYRQQMELSQQDLFKQNTVADYLFAKDKIFATLTLSDEELNLYQQIYALLNTRLPKPDLVVYLQARPEVLYKRVKKRDKKYEHNVTFEKLSGGVQAYNQFFFHFTTTPLLWISGAHTSNPPTHTNLIPPLPRKKKNNIIYA